MRKAKVVIRVAAAVVLVLTGCSPVYNPQTYAPKQDYLDRYGELHRKDIKESLTAKPEATPPSDEVAAKANAANSPPVPEVSQLLVAPRPSEASNDQLVSISVTEDVPIRDVFIELARLANLSLQMDSGVSGGVIYRAKDRPLNEVVQEITDMAGLRYQIKGRTLKVEVDRPYMKSYELDFLNVDRSSDGNVNISTNVLSAGEGGGGNALNTGSTSKVQTTNKSDLWPQFESAIQRIMSGTASTAAAATATSSAGSATAATGEAAGGADSGGAAASGGSGGGAAASSGAAATPATAAPAAASSATGAASAPSVSADGSYYVLNKEAGMLTVYGSSRQHSKVAAFIEELTKKASSQVLIEAKILEVTLDDKFRSGIDWGALSFKKLDLEFDVKSIGLNFDTQNALVFSARNNSTNSLESLINLVEQFGSTRTLSSPRLNATNNQQAVMTFAENHVYFELNIDRERDTTSGTSNELLTVDSTIKTVPIGLILVMQPSINEETQEITLNLRPTLSRVVDEVSDPAVAFLVSSGGAGAGANLENKIPVVEVREMDTIMKLKSGDIMVMGGLMQERHTNTDKGVPFVSSVPVFGNLFKSVEKDSEIVEMVILIKATIVHGHSNLSPQDIKVYKKFTNDPRPLNF